VPDLVESLEKRARRRYVRWDDALWQRVLDGPARTLASSLRDEGASDDDAQKKITGILNDGVGGIKGKANEAHYGDDDMMTTTTIKHSVLERQKGAP